MGKRQHHERGTATLEVAVMLPVFTFLTIALLYMGSAAMLPPRILANVQWAATQLDEQVLNDLPFDLTQDATANWVNLSSSPVLRDEEWLEIFSENDILEMSNEAAYDVTGSYTLDGQELVYSTDQNTTSEGRTTEKYQLNDLNEAIDDELGLYMLRSQASLSFSTGLPIVDDQDGSVVIDTSSPLSLTFEDQHSSVVRRKEGGAFGVPYRRTNEGMDGALGDDEPAYDRHQPESSFLEAWQNGRLNSDFQPFWESD
jgi:hypothetical protein